MPCGAGLALLGRGSMELTGGAAFCVSDPDYASVVLLASFDGADGSTAVTDSSTYADHKTCSAGEALSSTQSKFGGTSLQVSMRNPSGFNYSGTRFSRPAGTGYTIEFWYNHVTSVNSTASPLLILLNDGFGSPIITIVQYSTGKTLGFRTGTNTIEYFAFTPGADGWIHVACSIGTDNVARFYIDGVLKKSEGVGGSSGTWTLYVTGTGPETSTAQEVYMDDLRITQGVDRYPSAFTPPTQAFCYDGWGLEATDPPTTVPPESYTDPLWGSVRFLSAMDLTKVNEATDVTYTQDSAAVTTTDPFDGAGALLCEYPPASPTSTPFSPAELATLTLRGAQGQTIEFWVRLDDWDMASVFPLPWANLVQQPGASAGEPDFALAITQELVRTIIPPILSGASATFDDTWKTVLKLYVHSVNVLDYSYPERKDMLPAASQCQLPTDGQWHHVALTTFFFSELSQSRINVFLDGSLVIAGLAPEYPVGSTLEFGGLVTPPAERGQTGYFYPSFPPLEGTTFNGAIDEIRLTAERRYTTDFVVPHYAFPRS